VFVVRESFLAKQHFLVRQTTVEIMQINGKIPNSNLTSQESSSEKLPMRLLTSCIQGMLGGMKWSVLVAFVMVAVRIAVIAFSETRFRLDWADFFIPFMILPVWVVIAGIVGLVRGVKKKDDDENWSKDGH